ncbi:hypothetical protein [Sneathiella sp.]|uniref:hypothetical protein n=1 Tax=Sneathiella sp. TaxID=1964365 RepID=UPI0026304982|nr:hypothetical protein [Sneathiella sp.]MDF2365783.1 hypothetical protein [Sneathiella sp.]
MPFSNFFQTSLRAATLAVPLLITSACSGSVDTNIFSFFGSSKPLLPCPQVEVLPGAETITIFREGEGRDLVDVRFEGVIAPFSGQCQYVDDDTAVVVELILRIGATKGPAATSQTEEFPFFVAIAERTGEIIAKKIFYSPVEVEEGRRRATAQEELEQRIPLTGLKTGGDYVIIIGFQLTREQLELQS